MARLFDRTDPDYLSYAAEVAGYPFAIACWFRLADIINNQTLVCLSDTAGDANYHALFARGDVVGDPLYAQTRGAAGSVVAKTTGGFTANTWHHGVALFPAATDRRVLLDGGNKDVNVTDRTPAGVDVTAIGCLYRSSAGLGATGRIAEVGIWDLSNWPGATAADKANEFERLAVPGLATRYSPLFFPLGLVGYWPLGGVYDADDGDHDVVGGQNMTPANGPTTADHPPGMIYSAGVAVFPAAVVAPAGAIMKQLQQANLGACTYNGTLIGA